MPLIALASLKGSPGVTTTCLALAAAWPGQDRRLLIEADPAGGDLSPWLALPVAPGLTGLAAAARHDHGRGLAWEHSRELSGELHLVMAPAGAEQASACLVALARSRVPASLAAAPQTVIVDCGRLDPGSPAMAFAARAQVTLLLVRPRVSDLSHVALRTEALSAAGARLALLLAPDMGGGGVSYQADEITATLGVPVQASVPADPRGVAALASARSGGLRKLRRQPLGRAAASLTGMLAAPRQHQLSPHATVGRQPAADRRAPHLAEVTCGDAVR